MDSLKQAITYLPHFYMDENEPFRIQKIGYQVITQSGPSPSFKRDLVLPKNAAYVIEYAVFWDYDIQHLYDLEHAWVYVSEDGKVVDAEGSLHGSYMNMYRLDRILEEETHVPLYLQPGKHAMMPRGELAVLFCDYKEACDEKAGRAGLLVTGLFHGKIHKPEGINQKVEAYLRKHHRFTPSLNYIPSPFQIENLMPMDALLNWIPERITVIVDDLMNE